MVTLLFWLHFKFNCLLWLGLKYSNSLRKQPAFHMQRIIFLPNLCRFPLLSSSAAKVAQVRGCPGQILGKVPHPSDSLPGWTNSSIFCTNSSGSTRCTTRSRLCFHSEDKRTSLLLLALVLPPCHPPSHFGGIFSLRKGFWRGCSDMRT